VTRAGLRLTAIALAAWLLCFAVLARWGTWLPFAGVGAVLAVFAFQMQVLPAALLRPSLRRVGAGVFGGALMVAFTHVVYALLAQVVPSVLPATWELFWLLNVTGFSASERGALIVLIASCEEVLFRGPLLRAAARSQHRSRRFTRRELTRMLAFAAAYALTTVPLRSPLLTLCAFVCGSVWSLMGIVSGSLLIPILMHVIWDLGVLLFWPVATLR
jgi:membrane protease YdiL (CAAX protease family)